MLSKQKSDKILEFSPATFTVLFVSLIKPDKLEFFETGQINDEGIMDLINNRKARHDFQIVETLEAGIALQGTEVKSCRARQISIQEGFISVDNGEVWLQNTHIAPYEQGNRNNHEPKRKRKLLLHKSEILKLTRSVDQKGMTIIPLSLYLKRGKVKVKIGICKGKDQSDKRQTIKKREEDIRLKRMSNKKI